MSLALSLFLSHPTKAGFRMSLELNHLAACSCSIDLLSMAFDVIVKFGDKM
jgi:hypothetical protein